MIKTIQIVSFDVPYPPNYGGVIDVFYKIKAFESLGVDVILHTFEYGRGQQTELEKYCKEVYYYPRKSFLKSFLSTTPFIVKTRDNILLKQRLLGNKFPVLFEGLHSVSGLEKLVNVGVKTIVRAHNIEHNYYKGLAKSESNFFKKVFFKIEAYKLKNYESILNKADVVLSISPIEQDYFFKKYGSKSNYIPVFFQCEFKDLQPEQNIVLWHGDLRVSDNIKAALLAIEVVKNTKYKLIIASSTVGKKIKHACREYDNVELNTLRKENELERLLASAKINLLFTFQATGIKLKLLNALTNSRFVIANSKMIENTDLENLCFKADTIESVIKELNLLDSSSFLNEDREKRKTVLNTFKAEHNAQKIIDLL
ncbi:hypothetical protein FHR24_000537 [Wenyingzhuangia heitensis]|uniref:Uncharacterized protein n=1 Tax=Wenyingzhuangia heitensis TaxID=1487859 RepID=A0ABX0U5G3_9FLAO|nr:glycosyltransferase family 4 protein [Wenyingzhuangia heitensis]NIJ44098.1 hypothetical protein [Wenyingzhuangia heitensis]